MVLTVDQWPVKVIIRISRIPISFCDQIHPWQHTHIVFQMVCTECTNLTNLSESYCTSALARLADTPVLLVLTCSRILTNFTWMLGVESLISKLCANHLKCDVCVVKGGFESESKEFYNSWYCYCRSTDHVLTSASCWSLEWSSSRQGCSKGIHHHLVTFS